MDLPSYKMVDLSVDLPSYKMVDCPARSVNVYQRLSPAIKFTYPDPRIETMSFSKASNVIISYVGSP